jgi:hypothetical protein
MALAILSFTGTNIIKVTPGVSAPTLATVLPIIGGASFVSSANGQTFKIVDVETGKTVFYAKSGRTTETIQWMLPRPVRCNKGITVYLSAGDQAEIYLT